MVHYLLAIHKLKEERGYARVTDVADVLGLTKGSVSTAINNLKKKELVIEEDNCKFVILSDKGHKEVHEILSARTLLYYFLKDVLGVSEEIARRDSCLMEHLVSGETRDKFFDFMKKHSYCNKKSGKSDNRLFQVSLDLSAFKNAEDFLDYQEGDSFLIN